MSTNVIAVAQHRVSRMWLALPPILLGVVVLVASARRNDGPKAKGEAEPARTVRVLRVEPIDVVPRALGYGKVRPGQVWKAVAQVSGNIVEINPKLKKGAFIDADTVLLRIDPTEYELRIAQLEAGLQSARAEMEELRCRQRNEQSILDIEKQSLNLKQNDVTRQKGLYEHHTSSRSVYEESRRYYLAQKAKVQSIENALNLIPAQRQILEARIAQMKAQLDEAKLKLRYTKVTAPFNCRISEVAVEEAQFVGLGQVMTVGDSIDVAEVHAQFVPSQLNIAGDALRHLDVDGMVDADRLTKMYGITARVQRVGAQSKARWPARLARFSDMLDPQTHTVDIIVEVNQPYEKAGANNCPPLVKGMYCEVALRAAPLPNRLIVPRFALHEPEDRHDQADPTRHVVYVMNADGRLEKRDVRIEMVQSSFAIVREGLAPGDVVVVSDVVPAIEGMRLAPVADDELARQIAREAAATEGAVQ